MADATAEITTAWQSFFNPAGTVDSHIALLQDGEKFRTELTASSKDPTAKDLSAKVLKVDVAGEVATVTYNLLGKGGSALLSGATGEAVRISGHWLVGKRTYCQLITLQDPKTTHAGCA